MFSAALYYVLFKDLSQVQTTILWTKDSIIHLPFAIYWWHNVVIAGLFVVPIVKFYSYYNGNKDNKSLTDDLVFGLVAGLAAGLVAGLAFGLTAVLTAVLTAGLVFGLAAGLAAGLVFVLAAGLAAGLVFVLAAGLAAGLVFGLVFGLAAGLVFGLAALVIYLYRGEYLKKMGLFLIGK